MADELQGRDRNYGIFVGLGLFAALLLIPPPAAMPVEAWHVVAVIVLMATWWITEALPISATALVPLVAFPLLGVAPVRSVAAPYADPIIFLFLGGFIIGAGMQRWQLHRRIGLRVVATVGTAPHRLVGGLMLACVLLGMWVSNSATAIMMLPVALSVLSLIDRHGGVTPEARESLGIVLMLAVAYGASIGGFGTLIGTPPNALLAAYMAREHGVRIGFAQWMMLGVPVSITMLIGTWFLLLRAHPAARNARIDAGPIVRAELEGLGRMTAAEIRVAAIFALTALSWMTRPMLSEFVPALDDPMIAIAGALALFLAPSGMPQGGRLIAWDDLKDLPWGVLLLFGGGLTLADAITGSGLAAWLGDMMSGLSHWPVLLLVAVAVLGMAVVNQLTSNTASAAVFVPIGGAVAIGAGADPVLLTVPLTLAASCAFMLPVGTPPNAIVFSSGRITIAQMARAGFLINVYGVIVILAIGYPLAGWLFAK